MVRALSVKLREAVDRVIERMPFGQDGALVFAGPGGRRAVALTFDDGPSPHNTPAVLDLLGKHGAKATFFVVGKEIPRNEALLSRMVAEGHEIGNHTYTHPHTISLSREALREELERTSAAIRGITEVRLVRPPYGKDRRRVAKAGRELGLRMILWSLDSGDTSSLSADEISSELLARAGPGAIVLMHDGGDPRPKTMAALSSVVPTLIQRGFELVTVSSLLSSPAHQTH